MRLRDDEVLDPREQLLRRLGGKWVVAALTAAANLGVADALADEAMSAEELAVALDCHKPSLERLLRVLVSEDLLEDVADNRYGLTEVGRHLRGDSLGPLVRHVGSMAQWAPWANLDHSVRTGEAAFAKTHGMPLFDYLEKHPEASQLYDEGVDVFTEAQARTLADDEAFAETTQVVDVGGGRGTVLVELLARWPELRGVLYDLEHVVASPHPALLEEPLAERCDLVAGDFQASVPAGADCYVIKHVLHNWDDEAAVSLLKHCAEAMAPGGRVLVVEGLLLAGGMRDRTRLLDLEMLVIMGGGRERRKPEFRALFHQAGLKLNRSFRLADSAWCLEAIARR